jgi:hypothetical protein
MAFEYSGIRQGDIGPLKTRVLPPRKKPSIIQGVAKPSMFYGTNYEQALILQMRLPWRPSSHAGLFDESRHGYPGRFTFHFHST